MRTLLHIVSSPRSERSNSNLIAASFIEAYRAASPESSVATLDLWDKTLPRLDEKAIEAKYAVLHGKPHDAAQRATWDGFRSHLAPLEAADDWLISLPMWNFSIPYVLKHYIDVVTQPGISFSYSPDTGYRGLLTNKRAVLVHASGDAYGGAYKAMDFATPYLLHWLKFIGVSDVFTLHVAPMLAPPELAASARTKASEEARELAGKLAKGAPT